MSSTQTQGQTEEYAGRIVYNTVARATTHEIPGASVETLAEALRLERKSIMPRKSMVIAIELAIIQRKKALAEVSGE